jgi:hypothetical protein
VSSTQIRGTDVSSPCRNLRICDLQRVGGYKKRFAEVSLIIHMLFAAIFSKSKNSHAGVGDRRVAFSTSSKKSAPSILESEQSGRNCHIFPVLSSFSLDLPSTRFTALQDGRISSCKAPPTRFCALGQPTPP